MPDAIGLALEEWFRDKQGVQQELLADHTSGIGPAGGIPALEQITVSGPPANQIQMTFESANGGGSESFIGTCPDCGSQLEFAEGCVKCHVCGFSECG
jgi:ribonucleoside-diphosphate reductase alpha chain